MNKGVTRYQMAVFVASGIPRMKLHWATKTDAYGVVRAKAHPSLLSSVFMLPKMVETVLARTQRSVVDEIWYVPCERAVAIPSNTTCFVIGMDGHCKPAATTASNGVFLFVR